MDYLQPTIGLFALLALGAVFSENIKSIKIRYVVTGVLIQFILAILLTKVELISSFFNILSDGVMVLKAANDYGTGFVFGYLADGAPNAPFDINNPAGTFIFAFGGLTLVILMSAISALLWYWRVIPIFVNALSVLFKRPLNVGGPIGLGATANIFLGQVEAPLLIRPYLSAMTRHELLVIMTAGMSTIAGSVMVVYTTMLAPIYGPGLIGHFLSSIH
jgi:Nucleoside permease